MKEACSAAVVSFRAGQVLVLMLLLSPPPPLTTLLLLLWLWLSLSQYETDARRRFPEKHVGDSVQGDSERKGVGAWWREAS